MKDVTSSVHVFGFLYLTNITNDGFEHAKMKQFKCSFFRPHGFSLQDLSKYK